MKLFRQFADHPFGAWIINVFSVIAGILAAKLLVFRLPDSGLAGSTKALINSI